MDNFKEKSAKVKEIFSKYNKVIFYGKLQDSDQVDFVIKEVEFALNHIDCECAELLKKEYILYYGVHKWWENEYSKSAYYRNKRKAIQQFLDCLK